MSNLISAAELQSMIETPDVRVFDCRFDLANTSYGRDQYLRGHIPGSMYVSLDQHLTAQISAHGGRHPLPTVAEMAQRFGGIGVSRGSRVVAYDDSGGAYAARLWWMLRYCGHEYVRVLDGGWPEWIAAGGAQTTDEHRYSPSDFIADIREEMFADAYTVRRAAASGGLVDSRSSERFQGQNETIDPVAGHIPGARNLPWEGTLDEHRRLLPPETLAQRFSGIDRDTVFYCGSGVTACMNVLAAEESGCGMPRLYAGSWSDWITWPDSPVAVGTAGSSTES